MTDCGPPVAESGMHHIHIPLDRGWEDVEGLQDFWMDVGEREMFRPLPPFHIVLPGWKDL